MPLSDEQVDALLAVDEAESGHALEIFARIHERRRKRQHARARAAQPVFGITSGVQMRAVREFACAPITADEREMTGMDYLCQTVIDTLQGESVEDVLHALLRVWRKQYAWQPHLGPIEHGVHEGCPCIGCRQAAARKEK